MIPTVDDARRVIDGHLSFSGLSDDQKEQLASLAVEVVRKTGWTLESIVISLAQVIQHG